MPCCSPPACSSSGSATRASLAGGRCSTGRRTTRHSRVRVCGSSSPVCVWAPAARRWRSSATRSRRLATRPCGRSGACGGSVSSAPGNDVLADPPAGDGAAADTGGAVLRVRDLSVEYAMERGTVRAVDNVSFDLDPGEFIGVVGESGCGKATLLFAVAQLLVPPAAVTGGSVVFRGQSMLGLPPPPLASLPSTHLPAVHLPAVDALTP